MKLTLKLTLDGLKRALRARAHAIAEEIETGRGLKRAHMARRRPAMRDLRQERSESDDSGRG